MNQVNQELLQSKKYVESLEKENSRLKQAIDDLETDLENTKESLHGKEDELNFQLKEN